MELKETTKAIKKGKKEPATKVENYEIGSKN